MLTTPNHRRLRFAPCVPPILILVSYVGTDFVQVDVSTEKYNTNCRELRFYLMGHRGAKELAPEADNRRNHIGGTSSRFCVQNKTNLFAII